MKLLKSAVEKSFMQLKGRVLTRKQLDRFILEQLENWIIKRPKKDVSVISPKNPGINAVVAALVRNTELKSLSFPFPYRTTTRYTWGDVATEHLVQSLDPKGYYSHYSALRIHQLTDQIPRTIYFNVEQPMSGGGGELTQQSITRAFKNKCRVSSNYIVFRDVTIVRLNGQNTNRLGVVTRKDDDGFDLSVTNLERTLIDSTVRPIYSGGVAEVANAFKAAAPEVSVNRLVAYLRKLNFTYPYHQSIGFYMSRTNAYTSEQMDLIKDFPIEYDFYLDYQIKHPQYVSEWKLFVPKGLE